MRQNTSAYIEGPASSDRQVSLLVDEVKYQRLHQGPSVIRPTGRTNVYREQHVYGERVWRACMESVNGERVRGVYRERV
jgi:hypothetical protein